MGSVISKQELQELRKELKELSKDQIIDMIIDKANWWGFGRAIKEAIEDIKYRAKQNLLDSTYKATQVADKEYFEQVDRYNAFVRKMIADYHLEADEKGKFKLGELSKVPREIYQQFMDEVSMLDKALNKKMKAEQDFLDCR